ncbi:class I SAM-dependent methyltransferase [Polaribacter dokdonensis]|uniref:Methyltransferase domain-containing protein n=1 Tax=Polaribacter dokdonensis DSW-5 TaxID=1300348 RepID=A0A0M9CIS5_9FLAO|nr:class I SAM-dependent methyltransferase [Polaribacter dokdonensis]KOY52835.1 Methyltransferase family protein [Polaribacter dokdonensis DSW-5]SEE53145.1 Methyltransferase domain-containing protein [Polaribacter dokdonensis DSW-5]
MKNFYSITLLCFLSIGGSFSSFGQIQENVSRDYTYKKGDFNGIGKWYLGREIAYVMGFEGINWLERSSREKEENTSKLIKNMNIKATDVIADIGAGSGYHVFKMASLNYKGDVYAVDIQPEMLNAILRNPKFEKYTNIELVQGDEKSVNLPENTFDKVLMVDVYHEFSYPKEMILSIKKALKSEGKIYLIEYRMEDTSVPIKTIHKMSEKQAIKELEAAGFKLDKNIGNLPWQHCMVFSKQ